MSKPDNERMRQLHLQQIRQQQEIRRCNEASPSKPSTSGAQNMCIVQKEENVKVKTEGESEDSEDVINITKKKVKNKTGRKGVPSALDTKTRKAPPKKKGHCHRKKLRHWKRRLEKQLCKGKIGRHRKKIRQRKEDELHEDSEWVSTSSEPEMAVKNPSLPGHLASKLHSDDITTDKQPMMEVDDDGDELDHIKEHEIPNSRQLEKTIAQGCAKNKLTSSNVKYILRTLISNDMVKSMLKKMLSDNVEEPPAPVVIDYEPKLTRSKIKEVLEQEKDLSRWPVSPMKLGQSAASAGPSILDVEFPDGEDEEDEEYEPSKDLEDADSDDESFTSSQVSEMGSPFTLSSPSTPLPTSSSILGPSTSSADKSSAHALPSLTADVSTPQSSGRGGDLNETFQGVNSSMGPPLAPPPSLSSTRKRLSFQLEEHHREAEEEDGIARRTRSKLPLTTTSLYDIEEAFVAPDITPDMYDTTCDDTDWQDFLKSLHHTEVTDTHNESMELAEDDDPEFNYLAEAEQEEEIEAEDDRYNHKGFRVSRKELNSLMEELEDLFDDDFSVIDQRGSSTPASSGNAVKKPIAPNSVNEKPQVKPASRSFQWSQLRERKSNTTTAEAEHPSGDHRYMLDQQVRLLQHQLRQHIQLTSQMYLLMQCSEEWHTQAEGCAKMVRELDRLRRVSMAGTHSVYDTCNLAAALEIVNSDTDWASHRQQRSAQKADKCQRSDMSLCDGGDKTRVDSGDGDCQTPSTFVKNRLDRYQKGLLDIQKSIMWKSPVFMYPALLPRLSLVPRSALIEHGHTAAFSHWEDRLLVLGIEQFKDFDRSTCFSLTHRYLMPCKSPQRLDEHFNRAADMSQRGMSIIWNYKEEGKVPETTHDMEDFSPDMMRAPCDQPLTLLPAWCKRCHTQDRAKKRRQDKEERFNALMQQRRKKWEEQRQQRYLQQGRIASRYNSLAKSSYQLPAPCRKRKRAVSVEGSSSDSESGETTDSDNSSVSSDGLLASPLAKQRKMITGTSQAREKQHHGGTRDTEGQMGTGPLTPSDSPCAIITSMGVFVPLCLADPNKVDVSALTSQLSVPSESGLDEGQRADNTMPGSECSDEKNVSGVQSSLLDTEISAATVNTHQKEDCQHTATETDTSQRQDCQTSGIAENSNQREDCQPPGTAENTHQRQDCQTPGIAENPNQREDGQPPGTTENTHQRQDCQTPGIAENSNQKEDGQPPGTAENTHQRQDCQPSGIAENSNQKEDGQPPGIIGNTHQRQNYQPSDNTENTLQRQDSQYSATAENTHTRQVCQLSQYTRPKEDGVNQSMENSSQLLSSEQNQNDSHALKQVQSVEHVSENMSEAHSIKKHSQEDAEQNSAVSDIETGQCRSQSREQNGSGALKEQNAADSSSIRGDISCEENTLCIQPHSPEAVPSSSGNSPKRYHFYINTESSKVVHCASESSPQVSVSPQASPDNPSTQLDILRLAMKAIIGSPAKDGKASSQQREGESSGCSSAGTHLVSVQGAPSVVNTSTGVSITVNMICSPGQVQTHPSSADEAVESPSSTTEEKSHQGKTSQLGEVSHQTRSQYPALDDSVSSTSDIGDGAIQLKPVNPTSDLAERSAHLNQSSPSGNEDSSEKGVCLDDGVTSTKQTPVDLPTDDPASELKPPPSPGLLSSTSLLEQNEHPSVEQPCLSDLNLLETGRSCVVGDLPSNSGEELRSAVSSSSPSSRVQVTSISQFDNLPGEDTIHIHLAGFESLVKAATSEHDGSSAEVSQDEAETTRDERSAPESSTSGSKQCGSGRTLEQRGEIESSSGGSSDVPSSRTVDIEGSARGSPSTQTTDTNSQTLSSPSTQQRVPATNRVDGRNLSQKGGSHPGSGEPSVHSVNSPASHSSCNSPSACSKVLFLAPLASIKNSVVCLASISHVSNSRDSSSGVGTDNSTPASGVRRTAHSLWSGLSSVCPSADSNIVLSMTLPPSNDSGDSSAQVNRTDSSNRPALSDPLEGEHSDSGGNLPPENRVKRSGGKDVSACSLRSVSNREEASCVDRASGVSTDDRPGSGLSGYSSGDSRQVGEIVSHSPVVHDCNNSPLLSLCGAPDSVSNTDREMGKAHDSSDINTTSTCPTRKRVNAKVPDEDPPTSTKKSSKSQRKSDKDKKGRPLPSVASPAKSVPRVSFAGLLHGSPAVRTVAVRKDPTSHSTVVKDQTRESSDSGGQMESPRVVPAPLMSDDTMNALFDQMREGGAQNSASVTFGFLSSSSMSQVLVSKAGSQAETGTDKADTLCAPADSATSHTTKCHMHPAENSSGTPDTHTPRVAASSRQDAQTDGSAGSSVLVMPQAVARPAGPKHHIDDGCKNTGDIHGKNIDGDCGNCGELCEEMVICSHEWTREEDRVILEMVRDCRQSDDTFCRIAGQLTTVTSQQVCERLSTLLELLGSSEEETGDNTDEEDL